MSDIGIVIVTYNSGSEIGSCLDAALRAQAEVVVVDNASRDGTREEVIRRGVRLIANDDNRGFAAAVNQGIRSLRTPYILLLNPDAVIQTRLDNLRDGCAQPGVAGAGGRLVNERGEVQTGFMVRNLPSPAALVFEVLLLNRLWKTNPVNWHYRCLGMDPAMEAEVDQPAGAFLMIRRAVWEKLGGFDEDFYPLWFEDVDFAKRARDVGFRMLYVPEAVAKHTGGHSIPKISLEFRLFYWYLSLLRYGAKHFRPWASRAVCTAVIVGSILRATVEVPLRRSLRPIAAYAHVVRLAGRCLIRGRRGLVGYSSP